MKTLKITGLAVAALLVAVLVVGLVAPRKVVVERATFIGAAPSVVFRNVQYWRNWKAWSPWVEMDTAAVLTYEGVDGAPGSKYHWEGPLTGRGWMENTAVTPGRRLDYRLVFTKPFPSESDGYVALSESGGGITVTWGYSGVTAFPLNAVNLFLNLEKQLGPDFERGLVNLKTVCEAEMERVRAVKVKKVFMPARTYAVLRKTVAMPGMQEFFASAYPVLFSTLAKEGLKPAGAPAGLYFTWDEAAQTSEMAAAIPVARPGRSGEVGWVRVPAGSAYCVDHQGPFGTVVSAYDALDLHFAANRLTPRMPVVEEYLTDPSKEPDPSKWLTRVVFFAE